MCVFASRTLSALYFKEARNMDEIYLTKEGKEEKLKHLEYLKAVRRNEVAAQIKAAREYGDLSENSEYDAARAEQAMLESEITMLEETLRVAKIVDANKRKNDTVGIGNIVTVYDNDFSEEVTYTIVGSLESKPLENIISNQSPIGAALMGKRVGDVVNTSTPGGHISLKILEIK